MTVGDTAAPSSAGYDEAFARPGEPRPAYAGVFDELAHRDLAALKAALAERASAGGVAFGAGAQRRPFVIDPVPRILDAAEWAVLEAGARQRVRALNAFVADAYGPRRIVAAGVLPPDVIDGAEHFEPALRGAEPAGAPVVVAGLDVVRAPDGGFRVLEDNVRTPSGLAYAVAASDAVEHVVGRPASCRPLDAPFGALAAALRAAAPAGASEPHVVLLSDGPVNSAWFEHELIARRLGLPVVGVDDLVPRADGLYVRDGGGTRRVDVVYRRTDEDRLTDGDRRLTPVARRLLDACATGRVACANAFGTGVADDKLTHAHVDAMVRFYLGEEPALPSVPTYDLRDDAVRDDVLARLHEVVVKPRWASGGEGVVIGPRAGEEDLRRTAAAVREDPAAHVAQEVVWLSHHPTAVDGHLEPRHVDLRVFAFTIGDDVAVLPGGLTRVALDEGELVVNSSQRGGGKATWVRAS